MNLCFAGISLEIWKNKKNMVVRRHLVRRQCLLALILNLPPFIQAIDLDPTQMQVLKKHANDVAAHSTIVVSQTVCSYLAFVDNWILHAQRLGINNYLIIAEDEVSLRYINNKRPHHAVPSNLFGYNATETGLEFMNADSTDFVELSCKRPKFLATFLQLGYNVIWTDMDTAWLEDPFPLVPLHHDFVGVQEHCQNGCPLKDINICTCFMHMQPTNRVLRFLEEWHNACIEPSRDPSLNDQHHFNRVFQASGAGYLDYYIMPLQLYPSGFFAEKNTPLQLGKIKEQSFKQLGAGSALQPAWVHANHRLGKESKKAFLQQHGVWEVQDSFSYPDCTSQALKGAGTQQLHNDRTT